MRTEIVETMKELLNAQSILNMKLRDCEELLAKEIVTDMSYSPDGVVFRSDIQKLTGLDGKKIDRIMNYYTGASKVHKSVTKKYVSINPDGTINEKDTINRTCQQVAYVVNTYILK